jgi:hypothetical protein
MPPKPFWKSPIELMPATLAALISGDDVITFDDLPVETKVTDQYYERFGITFGLKVQDGKPVETDNSLVVGNGPASSHPNNGVETTDTWNKDRGVWGSCVPLRQHLSVYVGAFALPEVRDQAVTLSVFDAKGENLASAVTHVTTGNTVPLTPMLLWRPSADIAYFHISAGSCSLYIDDLACDPERLPIWIITGARRYVNTR